MRARSPFILICSFIGQRLPHGYSILSHYFWFIDDSIDDTLYPFLFQLCDFIDGTVLKPTALYDFDISNVVYLRDDDVFLKIGCMDVYRFG